jgi:hypothetical protein
MMGASSPARTTGQGATTGGMLTRISQSLS